MYLLPESFRIVTAGGGWRPISWDDNVFKKKLYTVYAITLMIVVIILTALEFLGMLLVASNLQEISDMAFVFASAVNVIVKFTNMICMRQRVLDLTGMLVEEQSLPKNSTEKEIDRKIKTFYRNFTNACIVMLIWSGTVSAGLPLLVSLTTENFILPILVWLPYEVTSLTRYLPTFIFEAVGLCVVIGNINCGSDCVICGIIALFATQFQFLSLRMQELPEQSKAQSQRNKLTSEETRRIEAQIVAEHIRHHLNLIKFADDFNETFTPTITTQFITGAIIMALGAFQLAKSIVAHDFVRLIVIICYLLTMFTELFMYCWFSNQVAVKSVEFAQAIYHTDWTGLHIQTMKDLLIMMIRAQRPIVVSAGSLITLSLEAFLAIMKTAYSALNFLLQSLE